MTVTFAGHGADAACLKVWWRQEPAAGCLGGDWIDVADVPGGRLALTMGDASGHDDRAAALACVFRAFLRAALLDGLEPDDALSRSLEEVAVSSDMEEMFATAFVALADPATGVVTYANAGHPAPVLIPGRHARGRAVQVLDATGPILSDLFAGTRLWSTRHLTLAVDDGLLLYTDGITEARDADGCPIGADWFLADRRRKLPPEQLLAAIFAEVDAHHSEDTRDDRSAAVLARVPLQARSDQTASGSPTRPGYAPRRLVPACREGHAQAESGSDFALPGQVQFSRHA
jgi:serine phosphatase RsbU (regulator of sigma subunit)